MIIFVISILLVVLIGTFLLNFHQTKTYLENQLESHAQDTATSLGLSLSSVGDLEEPSSMETMINAVFDRGSYAYIALINTEEKPIYFRATTEESDQVPNWFINIVPIQAPSAESIIQSGWIPIGRLKVQSNPELAYIKLWENTIAISMWFLIATLITIVLAYVAIRVMLAPLKRLEEQADAIVQKEYLIQETLPTTTEFRRVVSAMNSMVNKMKSIFDRDAKLAKKLQIMAYQDSVTGLSNRVHFEMNIKPLLDDKTDAAPGIMCMIRIHNLKELNDKYGYLTGDKFMQLLASKLKKLLPQKETLSARLNGTELISVAPSANSESILLSMQEILDYLPTINTQLNTNVNDLKTSIGIIDYLPGEKRQQLLSNLDYAIDKAQQSTESSLFYEASNNQQISNDNWTARLNLAIKEKRFLLYQQSTCSDRDTVHSKELFIRLKDSDGSIHSAGYFMPVVQRLKKENEIDQLVIEMAIHYLESLGKNSKEHIAINLTTVKNTIFVSNIKNKVKKINPERIAFEAAESLISDNEKTVIRLINELKGLGAHFGIDNFGSRFSNMAYLQDVRPNYIKLDAAFSHSIESDEQTRSYISSLVDMCHSLDIEVIAMAVENKEQQQAFSDLGIHLYQGYLFNAPKALEITVQGETKSTRQPKG